MENWGLITYGEQTIVYNPETSSVSGKQYAGLIFSHELTHQVRINAPFLKKLHLLLEFETVL
jgi:hypothetical protein